MTALLRSHRWIAWLALVLLACVPLRAATGDAWLWSLGDPVCEQGTQEPCEELGHGGIHHCHCLDAGFPESSRNTPGPAPTGATTATFDPVAGVSAIPSQVVASASPMAVDGPPDGCPLASGVGLTLHD